MILKIQEDHVHWLGCESSSGLEGRRGTGFVMRGGRERIGSRRNIAVVRLQQMQLVAMSTQAVMGLDGGSALKQVNN